MLFTFEISEEWGEGKVVIICKGERSGICVQRTIDGGLCSSNSHFG
jgi:hypothetical protein